MIRIRRSNDRGSTKISWLDGRHSFSFGEYHDPLHQGFRALRVINEDRVAPASGFQPHSHRDMEIITVVLEGELEHQDSMGNRGVIRPGDTQRMTAGTGVTHSEINPSPDKPVHLLQIWLHPEARGLIPGYEQKHFSAEARKNRFCLAASPDARDGSMKIHQDAEVWLASSEKETGLNHRIKPGRFAWVQVIKGSFFMARDTLKTGDGASFEDEPEVALTALEDSEVLLFDLA